MDVTVRPSWRPRVSEAPQLLAGLGVGLLGGFLAGGTEGGVWPVLVGGLIGLVTDAIVFFAERRDLDRLVTGIAVALSAGLVGFAVAYVVLRDDAEHGEALVGAWLMAGLLGLLCMAAFCLVAPEDEEDDEEGE